MQKNAFMNKIYKPSQASLHQIYMQNIALKMFCQLVVRDKIQITQKQIQAL
uniref:Uncharacterized protein n=1 Tax=Arundo donax TaxID=35708 RepID=A0A0A9AFD9_ARUDO